MKYTTETFCQHNSSETAGNSDSIFFLGVMPLLNSSVTSQQNLVKLICSDSEGHAL